MSLAFFWLSDRELDKKFRRCTINYALKRRRRQLKQTITFKVSLPFRIKKENGIYISNCPILDVWSQGPSKKVAIENLAEAVQLFLINCYKRGVLDQVLKESGFVPLKALKKKRAARPATDTISVSLPFEISSQSA